MVSTKSRRFSGCQIVKSSFITRSPFLTWKIITLPMLCAPLTAYSRTLSVWTRFRRPTWSDSCTSQLNSFSSTRLLLSWTLWYRRAVLHASSMNDQALRYPIKSSRWQANRLKGLWRHPHTSRFGIRSLPETSPSRQMRLSPRCNRRGGPARLWWLVKSVTHRKCRKTCVTHAILN